MYEGGRERECVCKKTRGRERECVCMREGGRESM